MIKKIFNKKNIILIFLSIFFLAILLFFLKNNFKKENYQTVNPTKETIIESIQVSGNIVDSNIEIITTQATGIVKKVYVKNGQKVKKNDKILEIDLDKNSQEKYLSAWNNYLSAKNNLDSAQANLYTLQIDLFNKWKNYFDLATSPHYQNSDGTPNLPERQNQIEFLTTEAAWKAAEEKYKNQEAQINQLKNQLSSLWISYLSYSPIVYSPADGIVEDLIYEEGMNIGSLTNGQTATKIAILKKENNKIYGKFYTTEIDVNKIKSGQKAIITIDALGEKTYTGEVLAVDKTGEISSSVVSYPLTIKFDTYEEEILPNMSARASIIINKKINVLTLPTSAIINQNNSNYVRVLKNNQLIMIPVEVGISSDTKTEIISGISENDKVILSIISNNQNNNNNQSPFSSFGIGGGTRIRMR